jgi:hypothetical protein
VVKHIGFPDPAQADGTEEERMTVFRHIRDGLREQVISYLENDVNEQEVHFDAKRNLST